MAKALIFCSEKIKIKIDTLNFLECDKAKRRQRNKIVGTTGIYKGLMKQKKLTPSILLKTTKLVVRQGEEKSLSKGI